MTGAMVAAAPAPGGSLRQVRAAASSLETAGPHSPEAVSALLRELPYRISVLRPPYGRGVPLLPDAAVQRPAGGSIFIISIPRPGGDADTMRELLPRLRGAFPSVPVVALVCPATDREVVHFACRAGRLNLRAVVLEGEPMVDTLTPILTDWGGMCDCVVEWLGTRRVVLSPALGWLVQNIFRLAPAHRTVAPVLRMLGQPETSARFRFRKKRLPPPQRWHHAARALHTALQIQAHPDRCLLRLALEHGYGSHAAMTRQFVRVFGVRPGAVRGTLGWEWLLDAWAERHVAVRPAARA